MTIVVAGGTGFLGRPLAALLAARGHTLVLLSRRPGSETDTRDETATSVRTVPWTPDGAIGPWATVIDGADAVVNLAGESIADRRWTAAQKTRIVDSRLLATRSLAEAVRRAAVPPSVLVSGSAVGYYGPCGDEQVTEATASGHDFLADVCVRWEAEALRAASGRTRVVTLRTGIVIARDGGALPKMLPPFWFGVGGPVGSGRQYWPWIHRTDWLTLAQWAVENPAVSGPLNVTAPTPVTNRAFATALGRAIHRPAWMPTPGFTLKLLLGEMAEGLLLSGQRAVPEKAERLGFRFRFPQLDTALADLFKQRA